MSPAHLDKLKLRAYELKNNAFKKLFKRKEQFRGGIGEKKEGKCLNVCVCV